MKVLKICFVFDAEHWDEARELLSEAEIREALQLGGMFELSRHITALQEIEHTEITEERGD